MESVSKQNLNFLRKVLTTYNWDQIKKLHQYIISGSEDKLISIRKVFKNKNDYKPLHHFSLYHIPEEIQFELWLFDKIGYILETKIYINDFWIEVEKIKKVYNIVGLHYEQDFTENTKQFWLRLKDDTIVTL